MQYYWGMNMEYDIGEYLSYHRHKYIKEKGVINKKKDEIKRLKQAYDS